MKKRLDYIDKAKGFLIILVVIGHIWQSGPVFDVIYSFHMPAFFLISGLLLNETRSYEKKFGSYLLSRLRSIGIPFIWIEILGCITDIVRHGALLNVKGYVFNTLILDFNDPNLWFLLTLFLIELLFFWMIKAVKRKTLLFAMAACLFVLSFFVPKSNPYIAAFGRAFYYLLFFAFGFCWSELVKKFNAVACGVSIAVVFAVGLLLDHSDARRITFSAVAFLASGVCGSYAVIQLGKVKFPGLLNRMLEIAGMNTITIYGTHHFYYVVMGVLFGISDYSTTPILPGIIMLIGVAILEIPTIYLINRWAPWLVGKRKPKNDVERQHT